MVVPASGPLAGEGVDAVKAVRQVAADANAVGGTAGREVQVVVAASEDRAAVESLSTRTDVVVGGFAVPSVPKVPWLMPADPDVGGDNVIRADLAPRAAGARLAQDLADRHIDGQVGVVVGDGPEAALADGLTEKTRTTTVKAAADTSCENEVADLHKLDPQPVAVAIAAPPSLATRCVDALAKASGHPAGGILLAPSAAYAGIQSDAAAQGARTFLGVPWPTSTNPGAARFRAAVPKSTSYRAMVSFAGAELAVAVARNSGARPVTVGAVVGGTWHGDLFDFQGGNNRAVTVVVAGPKEWAPPG